MEFTPFLSLASVFLLLFLFWFWNYKKKVAGFPVENVFLWFIQWKIAGKISNDTPITNVFFEELLQQCKLYIKEGLFMIYPFRPILIIYGSEAVKFFANEKTAIDKSPEYKILEEAIGAGIDTSNGQRWKTHRKVIDPAFHMRVLKEKVSLFNEHAMALVRDMEKMAGKPSVDILGILKIYHFCALSESILGLKQDERNKEKILKFAECIDNLASLTVNRFVYPWLCWRFLLNFFPAGRKFLKENKKCDDFISNTILDMKKHITSNKNEDEEYFGNHFRKSFTYLVLKHHENNHSTFTFEDLHHEVKTMMVAGYDTTSYTTMWCLFLLGIHPEIQEKAFAEIQSRTNDYITYEESCDLKYLEAIIMETLRLYPTVPIFGRTVLEDIQYDKYKIFKGSTVLFFLYAAHRDPNVYPDPEKFDPNRYLNAEGKKAWRPIPFSEGKRSCIGKNYAIIEMRIFLAHILRNFKITCLDRKEDIKLCWAVTLSPLKPLRFKITPRNNTSS